MARFAITQRPPVLSSLCLLAAALLLEPGPTRVVQVAPDPLGAAPPCLASGVWHGDLYVPDGLWNMPVLASGGPLANADDRPGRLSHPCRTCSRRAP